MANYEVRYRIWTEYKVVVEADTPEEARSEVVMNYFEMDDAKAVDGNLDVTEIELLVENSSTED